MISKNKRRLVERLRTRRGRERTGLAVVEGPRVAREALLAGVPVRWAAVGEGYADTAAGRELVAELIEGDLPVQLLADDEVMTLGVTATPQPVLLVVEPPGLRPWRPAPGRYLIADAVQDPGNLGTLIRSAWSFGLSGVLVGVGSVDPWSDKVVRASAGALFRVPLFHGELARPEPPLGPLYYADASGRAVDDLPRPLPGDWLLAVGNEGSGVSEHVRARGQALAVPMAGGVDSLNVAVAGSILMYVLSRPAPSTEPQAG